MMKSQAIYRVGAGLVLVFAVLLLVMLTVLPGCTAKEVEVPRLKVVVLPYLGSCATFYIAQEEGYFAEQGIEVEFAKLTASSDAMPLLAQGDIDVTVGSMSASLINAIASDIDIRIVAGRTYVSSDRPSDALVVRQDLYQSGELDTVSEIKGRQVASPCLGCLGDFALTRMLETSGLSIADVKIIKMPMPNIIAALENKAIDAAILDGTYSEKVEALGLADRLVSFSEVIPGFQKGFTMFGPSLLSKNPDLGEKFMIAYLKGDREFSQGKTERNVAIIQKYTGMDEETLLELYWDPVYTDGRIQVEDLLTFQQWAFENGYVDKKIEQEQFIDTRFIEYANKVLDAESQ